jgi:hypothetical protein
MRRELVNRQKEEQAEAEVDEKANIDSVDSVIFAWGTHMRMGTSPICAWGAGRLR